MFFHFLEALFLVAALSLDAFAASLAFGAQGIRVPISSVVVISAVCSVVLGVSLVFGRFASVFVSPQVASYIAFAILTLLGVLRLFDSLIKVWIRKSCDDGAGVEFCFLSFRFLLRVYADSTEADVNGSNSISVGEAASLAVALSLDGLATGFGAGIASTSVLVVIGLSLVLGVAAVELGCALGRRMVCHAGCDFSWIGGAVLMTLGCLKLI